jgi:hypothetical protein
VRTDYRCKAILDHLFFPSTRFADLVSRRASVAGWQFTQFSSYLCAKVKLYRRGESHHVGCDPNVPLSPLRYLPPTLAQQGGRKGQTCHHERHLYRLRLQYTYQRLTSSQNSSPYLQHLIQHLTSTYISSTTTEQQSAHHANPAALMQVSSS